MWYVIQTLKGREYKVCEEIIEKVPHSGDIVFVFENELQYRIKGNWIKDRKPFFPGYVFADLDIEDTLLFNKNLKKEFPSLKLMTVDGVITPISVDEQDYLLHLGGEEHIIRHSVGFRVDDMVEITAGAFKGYKGEIRKLDRHNRRARVCVPLMGRDLEVQIGLEIVKNITFAELGADEQIDRHNVAHIVPNMA